MYKSIPNGLDIKKINVRLKSSIDDLIIEGIDYGKLDTEIPLGVFIRLNQKQILNRDFLIMLGKSYCDADFLKEIITLKNKKEIEKMHRLLDKFYCEETPPGVKNMNNDESSINDEKNDLEHQKYDMDHIMGNLECMKSDIDKAMKRIRYWYGDPL